MLIENKVNLIIIKQHMTRDEIYQAIDDLHNSINRLKGEYIALTDDEVKKINNAKFNFRCSNVNRDIEAVIKLAYDIQSKRHL